MLCVESQNGATKRVAPTSSRVDTELSQRHFCFLSRTARVRLGDWWVPGRLVPAIEMRSFNQPEDDMNRSVLQNGFHAYQIFNLRILTMHFNVRRPDVFQSDRSRPLVDRPSELQTQQTLSLLLRQLLTVTEKLSPQPE